MGCLILQTNPMATASLGNVGPCPAFTIERGVAEFMGNDNGDAFLWPGQQVFDQQRLRRGNGLFRRQPLPPPSGTADTS